MNPTVAIAVPFAVVVPGVTETPVTLVLVTVLVQPADVATFVAAPVPVILTPAVTILDASPVKT